MKSGMVAALLATLALGFIEGLARFYPARPTWRRLRRAQGRQAVRAMRERLEAVARRKSPRVLAVLLLVLVTTWIASASLLDKRWHEVVLDVLPYLIVEAALLRVQPGMRSIAARMKGFEREVGDDPDSTEEDDGGGPTVIAL